jgi:hypothetical protein
MINELLAKYKDQKKRTYGEDFEERCYPVSAVIAMLEEQAKELKKPVDGIVVVDKEKLKEIIKFAYDLPTRCEYVGQPLEIIQEKFGITL